MQRRHRNGKVAVPMELLQKRRGALLPDQQVALIKIAAQRPEDKRRDINNWVRESSPSMQKTAQEFKVQVENQPATVQGRLLPAPVLEYGKPSHHYAGSSGAWNMLNVRSCKLPSVCSVPPACSGRALCLLGGCKPHAWCAEVCLQFVLFFIVVAAQFLCCFVLLFCVALFLFLFQRLCRLQHPLHLLYARSQVWRVCRAVCLAAPAEKCCICLQFKLLGPVTIRSWVVVVLKDSRDLAHDGAGSLRRFGDSLVQAFTGMGITMAPVRFRYGFRICLLCHNLRCKNIPSVTNEKIKRSESP